MLIAGAFGAHADAPQGVQSANRVILHSKDGETKVYRFSGLDYMEFAQVAEPAAQLVVKEGTLTDSCVTLQLTGEFDRATILYQGRDENTVAMATDYKPGAEVTLSGLRAGATYEVTATPFDVYGIKGEDAGISFTTPAKNVAPKIGDYFYSDGTWSDGGLVSINADGTNAVWAAARPNPEAGKTVVGIVCITDPSRIAPEDAAAGYTHGYVISTRNLTDPLKKNYAQQPETIWYGGMLSEGSETKVVKSTKSAYERVSGRQDSQAVLAAHAGYEAVECPMFYRASILPNAPASSSGWFVPSAGQVWDCVANLCSGIVAQTLAAERTNTRDFTAYCSYKLNVNVMQQFMKAFENVRAADKDEIKVNDYSNSSYGSGISFRTSNRYADDSTIIFNLGTSNPGLLEGMAAWRDEDCHARAFLAF